MSPLKHTKINSGNVLIIVLVALNLFLLTLMWTNKSQTGKAPAPPQSEMGPPPPSSDDPFSRLVRRELGFDDQQMESLLRLRTKHFQEMNKVQKELRALRNEMFNTISEDPEAAKYAWGIGFHWYETWAGGDPMFTNLGNINESFPTKNLLFTEGCQERFDPAKYQHWAHAERYGRSMINDFNNGTVGWTDWNILLDQGGSRSI